MENNIYVELITGCMKAGKSKYLIDNYANEDIEAYKPVIDTRNSDIISRAYGTSKVIPCTKISSLKEVKNEKSIVIIDEYQFFDTEELKEFVKKSKQQHKKIVLAGLDLLASGEEWLNYTWLKSLADKQIKLTAKCDVCGKKAEYTELVNGDKNKKIQIEGEAIYEARCKKHFVGDYR